MLKLVAWGAGARVISLPYLSLRATFQFKHSASCSSKLQVGTHETFKPTHAKCRGYSLPIPQTRCP